MCIFQEGKADGFQGERYFVIPTETFQNYADDPQVGRMYLTDIGFFPHASRHFRERKEGIEAYIYLYCTQGKGIVNIDGTPYHLKENEAFCIPKYQRHFYYADPEDPWSILWVHFKGTDADYYPLNAHPVVPFSSEHGANRMAFLFNLLFRVAEENYSLGNFIYMSQVLQLILAETYHRERHPSANRQNRYVTNMVRYMYQHLSEHLTLAQISGEFGLSKSYIHSIFHKSTGHAPLDFFIRLKMKEACKLLRRTDIYIYEVAQMLGYQDPYYFSRVFKKLVGVSPRAYQSGDFFSDGPLLPDTQWESK